MGPWNEEEIVSKGEKRRKVDHLKKIRAITQGVKNNDDDLDDDIDDEENEEIDEDEKDTNDNNNKIMNKDKEIKNNNGNNNEIKNMEDEINDNVNIDELKGPNDIS